MSTLHRTNKDQTDTTFSALSRFSLDFEYNKPIQQIRREVRSRTHKVKQA